MRSPHRDGYQAVLATAQALVPAGLSSGTSGNVSARLADGQIVITPTSVPYDQMSLDDLVLLTADGEQIAGSRPPSSEVALHLACYDAFAEIGAVLHTHPPHATMFACARQPIPAVIDEAVIFIGGPVPVADYAVSGTAEVGANAVRVLRDSGSALLANHGMVTVAGTASLALRQAAVAEHCAQVAWGTRAIGGHVPLPEDALRRLGTDYRAARREGLR